MFRQSYSYPRPTAKRDRAIILTLLDTGLRARELCSLNMRDVELKTGRVEVKHGVIGGVQKGEKEELFTLGKPPGAQSGGTLLLVMMGMIPRHLSL